jgi:UDP-GlcNAc3NAcA epimerase
MTGRVRMLTVIGARPQIIKAAAVSRAVRERFQGRIEELLLHTGQHYDANMSQVFFDELGVPRADIHLAVGSDSHGRQTARMIEGIEHAVIDHRPDVVLLYGDTNSTLAGAVAAARLGVPVAHVEAGLRSFNKHMPEEVNRIVCDHCSRWLFCPTDTAVANLAREGSDVGPGHRPGADHPAVLNVGDVMYDNSMHFATLAAQRSTLLAALGLHHAGYALVTVHRDNNTDHPDRLNAIFRALLDLSLRHGLAVVLPVHPRLRKCMDTLLDPSLGARIRAARGFHLIPPAGFLDMIALERGARIVLTDSGGVQKEAYFFGKPCVILRPETEWVELVQHGQAVVADVDEARIATAAERFLSDGAPDCPPIFGDGHAAEKICERLTADLPA